MHNTCSICVVSSHLLFLPFYPGDSAGRLLQYTAMDSRLIGEVLISNEGSPVTALVRSGRTLAVASGNDIKFVHVSSKMVLSKMECRSHARIIHVSTTRQLDFESGRR